MYQFPDEKQQWMYTKLLKIASAAELVLAALPRPHDGDDRAFVALGASQDRVGNFGLIGIERFADDVRGKALDRRHVVIGVFTILVSSSRRASDPNGPQ